MVSALAQLRKAIEERGLTQTHAAREAGLNPSTINKILSGKRSPDLRTALAIARVFGVEVEAWTVAAEPSDDLDAMPAERFGLLVVVGEADSQLGGEASVACLCDCGLYTIIKRSQLESGRRDRCTACARELRDIHREAVEVDRKRRYAGGYSTSAQSKLRRAVKRGLLTRPATCERCGCDGRIVAHHDDYARPLDVMWLCTPCHGQRHVELRELAAQELIAQESA